MKPKVLAVDDDTGVLALLEIVLSDAGFDLTICTTASDFGAAQSAQVYDVFLIDLGLMDGDGLALVRNLRKTTQAGIVLLTGQSAEADRIEGLASGADDYITKPFRLRDLAQRVTRVFERATQRRADGAGPSSDSA